MDISKLFEDAYLNSKLLYFSRYSMIPNEIYVGKIDEVKAKEWLIQNYSKNITDCNYNKGYNSKSKKFEIEDACFFLFDDLLVTISVI